MKIQKLVVHHSATNSVTTKRADIERWHRQRGFSQIGYHKVIEGDGGIVDGRPETIQGAHARGANHASLGVCVVGNFETEVPSAPQIEALVDVLTGWCNTYKLDETCIYGHFNVPGGTTRTACPGRNLKNQLPAIKQKVAARLRLR
ncbi:MAG: N-acetylmuramoyl-L-alanine amidase [Deferribacteres bacterium]|nr:N-acetylmuramoyl-L-alanine amidase [Deferribacteres bacterium]